MDKKLTKIIQVAKSLESNDMSSLFIQIVQILNELESVKESMKTLKDVDSIQVKGLRGDTGKTPQFGIDFLTPEQMQEIKDTLKPIAGTDFPLPENGDDGYTPIIGEDYFTEQDKKDFIKKIVAYLPQELDRESLVTEVYQKLILKELSGQEIATKLNTLTEVIDASVIKDLPTAENIIKELKDPKGKYKLDYKDILNRPEKNPLDQRWHGGGLSKVSHNTTLTGDGTPSNPLGVNTSALSSSYKQSVFLATVSNIIATYNNGVAGVGATLTTTSFSPISIDGVGQTVGNRILVKNQSSTFQNGIYVITQIGNNSTIPNILTRATDYDQSSEIMVGDVIYVVTGTLNHNSFFVQTASNNPIMGTGGISFTNNLTAGNLNVLGTSFFTGASTFASTVSVVGTLGAVNNFVSGGLATFNGNIVFAGDIMNADETFVFSDTEGALSLGRLDTVHNATLEARTTMAQTVSAPISPSAGLVQIPLLGDVNNGSAFQSAPQLGRPGSPTIFQDPTLSGFYIANGSTYDTQIYSYDGIKYSVIPSTIASFTDDNSGNPFEIQFTWTVPSLTSNLPTDYLIGLQINGGGFFYRFKGSATTGFVDNDGMYPVSAPTDFYSDFIASGITRFYTAYEYELDPEGNQYFSFNPYAYMMTDDNSGDPYQVTHTSLMGPGTYSGIRIIGSPDGVSDDEHHDITMSTGFTENADSWSGSNIIIPNNPGYLADGSSLTRTYDFYNTQVIAGTTYYSTSVQATTTDPNDGNYYYVQLSAGNLASTYKVIKNTSVGQLYTTNPSYDLSYTPYGDGTVVTPTTIFKPSLWAESYDPTGVPVVIKTVSGQTAPSFEFKDSTGQTQADFGPNFEWNPPFLADSDATISSFYYSLTAGRPVYKDSGASARILAFLNTASTWLALQTFSVSTISITGGTNKYVFTTNGSGVNSWAQVDLTASVSGVLPVANGGTHLSSYSIGDLLYASNTTVLSPLADVATGNALLSGGVTTAPFWGKINLTTHVTGVLPLANGGSYPATTADLTGQTATVSSVVTATSPNDGSAHQYSVGAYINVTAISAGTVTITYTFTDEASNARTLTLFPMGLTSASISVTGFIAFPTSTIRVKANTAITMVATFTGVSVAFDTGGSITRIN